MSNSQFLRNQAGQGKESYFTFVNLINATLSVSNDKVYPAVTSYLFIFFSVRTKIDSPSPWHAIFVVENGSLKLILVPSASKGPEKELQLVFPDTRLPDTSNVIVGFSPGYSPSKAIRGPEI